MKLSDRIRRWWKPVQWRDDHPLSPEERAQRSNPDAPDGYSEPQHGIGAESYDRVDVEREFPQAVGPRKPVSARRVSRLMASGPRTALFMVS